MDRIRTHVTPFVLIPFLLLAMGGSQELPAVTVPGDATYPECVAVDPESGRFFVGSAAHGAIYQASVDDDAMTLLVDSDAATIPTAYGLDVDDHGRLWVVGGPTGRIAVYDVETGQLVRELATPQAEATFLNDVAIAPDGYAYMTDSTRPTIFRAAAGPDGVGDVEAWLDLASTPIEYESSDDMLASINLNGIEAVEDALYTVQMNTGQVFRVDLDDGGVSEVYLGREDLTFGDGLAIAGRTMFVVRIAAEEIVTIELAESGRAGEVVERWTHDELDFPACAAVSDDRLLVVSTQFDRRADGDPELPFRVLNLRAHDLSDRSEPEPTGCGC